MFLRGSFCGLLAFATFALFGSGRGGSGSLSLCSSSLFLSSLSSSLSLSSLFIGIFLRPFISGETLNLIELFLGIIDFLLELGDFGIADIGESLKLCLYSFRGIFCSANLIGGFVGFFRFNVGIILANSAYELIQGTEKLTLIISHNLGLVHTDTENGFNLIAENALGYGCPDLLRNKIFVHIGVHSIRLKSLNDGH